MGSLDYALISCFMGSWQPPRLRLPLPLQTGGATLDTVDGGTHGERSERGSSAHTGLVSGRRYIASANGPPPFKPIYTGVLYIIHLDNG